MKPVTVNLTEDMVKEHIRNGKRPDGRKMDEYRKLEITYNDSENADGSARVRLGKTDVVAGIKLEVGTPFPDTPDEGAIITNIELLPLASPHFEAGPPREGSIEIARVVDRGIRESKTIDLKKLCITEGEEVFMVFIDLYVLNDSGNLLDAAEIAAIAALNQAQMPKLDKDNKIIRHEYDGKLGISKMPVLSTFAKIGSTVMLDPSTDEENAMNTRFSVATTEEGNITAFQKSGSGSFSPEEINKSIDIALGKSKDIRKLLK